MEIDKETVTAKASKFAGQAKELLSKVDTAKAMGMTDKFTVGVFKFGKVIAALFMFLCILTMVGSLIYYVFAGASSVQIPDFDDIRESIEKKEASADADDEVSNKEFKEVRANFGSKVESLIELCKLDADKDFTRCIKQLCRLEKEYRGDYINGAISFIKDWKKYMEKDPKAEKFTRETGDFMLRKYSGLFNAALEDAQKSAEISKVKRSGALTICGGAFVGLILFLIIPLLIQIEENTRK